VLAAGRADLFFRLPETLLLHPPAGPGAYRSPRFPLVWAGAARRAKRRARIREDGLNDRLGPRWIVAGRADCCSRWGAAALGIAPGSRRRLARCSWHWGIGRRIDRVGGNARSVARLAPGESWARRIRPSITRVVRRCRGLPAGLSFGFALPAGFGRLWQLWGVGRPGMTIAVLLWLTGRLWGASFSPPPPGTSPKPSA